MSRFEKPKKEDFPYFPENVKVLEKLDMKYLVPGCSKPDCIVSIDKPTWVTFDKAREMWAENQLVQVMFTLESDSIDEVYVVPISVLNVHEIINFIDSKGNAVAITYCPLCQTASNYNRILRGKELQFGVSGLLLNSALVFYDRNTMSLISQAWSVGIVGDLTGKKLTQLPHIQTTLDKVVTKFPNARILSKETGFDRQSKMYDKNRYEEYATNKKLIFPVKRIDDKLGIKDLVYVITIDEPLIIPDNKLGNKAMQITNNLYTIPYCGGRLFFKGKLEVGMKWSNWLPSGISYYFTARAYHPDAEIY